MKASEVRQRWSEVVNEVARDKTRVIVEKSGVPVAGVVIAQDLEWLQERDRRLAELRETMDEMRQAFHDVPLEEFDPRWTVLCRVVGPTLTVHLPHDPGRPGHNVLVSAERTEPGPVARSAKAG